MKILLLLEIIFNICLRGVSRTGRGGIAPDSLTRQLPTIPKGDKPEKRDSGESGESGGSGGSGESGGSGGSGENGGSGGKISENLGKSQKISEVQVTNLCSSGDE